MIVRIFPLLETFPFVRQGNKFKDKITCNYQLAAWMIARFHAVERVVQKRRKKHSLLVEIFMQD